MNSTERKILVLISDLNPGGHHRRQMNQLMCQNVDGDRLIRIAIKEGLAGLLYKYLLEADLLNTISREQGKKLERLYYQLLYTNLSLTHALKALLHRLHQKDIQVVLLQGIDLIHQIYSDLGLRPMTDIDLWVLPKDYPCLIDILMSEGYRRDALYPNTFKKGATIFDIHTRIPWADRIPASKLLLRKDEEDIYNKTKLIHFEGETARCLSPQDHVLYLSLHVMKHYMNRMIWLVDIKNLFVLWDQDDWADFMKRAKELGLERVVVYILFFLSHRLDFTPPPNVRKLEQSHRLSALEKKILRKGIDGESLPYWAPVFLMSCGMGLRNRLLFMFGSLFPSPEILRQVFAASPDLKVWQLYLQRIFQVFDRK